jgi:Flp pilus assembly protein TadD
MHAGINAKSLIFSEKYIMLPLSKPPAPVYCGERPAGHRMSWVFCSAAIAITLAGLTPAAIAQTTVIAPAQQNNEFQEATLLFRGGQYDRALASVDAWLKTRPKDARGRFLRGMIFTQQKKTDEAARVYTDLTQDFPELPEPYNNLAVIYADQGDLDRARSLLESAVRANASFTAAHENLGDIHARLAAASYEKALKLDASNKAAAAKLKAVNDLIPARMPAGK